MTGVSCIEDLYTRNQDVINKCEGLEKDREIILSFLDVCREKGIFVRTTLNEDNNDLYLKYSKQVAEEFNIEPVQVQVIFRRYIQVNSDFSLKNNLKSSFFICRIGSLNGFSDPMEWKDFKDFLNVESDDEAGERLCIHILIKDCDINSEFFSENSIEKYVTLVKDKINNYIFFVDNAGFDDKIEKFILSGIKKMKNKPDQNNGIKNIQNQEEIFFSFLDKIKDDFDFIFLVGAIEDKDKYKKIIEEIVNGNQPDIVSQYLKINNSNFSLKNDI